MRLTVEGAATRIEGPLLFLRRTLDVGLADAVEVRGRDGRTRLGRIAAIDERFMTIEVLESTAGLALQDTVVRFRGEPLQFAIGPGILGRVFNGVGEVIDGGPPIAAHRTVPVEGRPMNPVAREVPRDFIETGITTLDLMNSLVRGQKLPLFSGGGLPHDRLAVEIAGHARLRPRPAERLVAPSPQRSEAAPAAAGAASGGDDFVIVFAAFSCSTADDREKVSDVRMTASGASASSHARIAVLRGIERSNHFSVAAIGEAPRPFISQRTTRGVRSTLRSRSFGTSA